MYRQYCRFKNNQQLIFEYIRSDLKVEDEDFDAIYPQDMRPLAEIHFTPVTVAKTAAQFLVEKPGTKVLDIGSGAGKFCMIGSACTKGYFTGVELRKNLHLLSVRLSRYYQLSNIEFIHSNVTKINFRKFNAFYFYNSFYENIVQLARIDNTIELNEKLYSEYSLFLKGQFDSMPAGTKLVTYFSYLDEIPDSFRIQSTHQDGKLLMWQKET